MYLDRVGSLCNWALLNTAVWKKRMGGLGDIPLESHFDLSSDHQPPGKGFVGICIP